MHMFTTWLLLCAADHPPVFCGNIIHSSEKNESLQSKNLNAISGSEFHVMHALETLHKDLS